MEEEWEVVVSEDDNQVRRLEVTGGWLYQVQCGRYISPGMSTWAPLWHPPVFVADS